MPAAKLPETNIGLMPAWCLTYDQGLRLEERAEVGKALTSVLADKGIILLELGLAGRRRRQPLQADRRRPKTPRA